MGLDSPSSSVLRASFVLSPRSLVHYAALCAAIFFVLWAEPAGAQCAMCRKALETPEGRQLAAAFRGGILVLLAAPFSLVAVIATLVVRMKKNRSA